MYPWSDEVLPHGDGLRDPTFPEQLSWRPLEDLVEHGLARRPAALGEPLLADDPRRIGNLQLAGDQRRHVVLAQEPADREGEPGVDDQGGDDRRDDPANEDAGQDADREGGQRPGGERHPAQIEQAGSERGRRRRRELLGNVQGLAARGKVRLVVPGEQHG